MAETMDAEKMAREWLTSLPDIMDQDDDDDVASLAALLTTARNAGLERGAEIADGHDASGKSLLPQSYYVAQAIRREIK
jgi:hypothetical protein